MNGIERELGAISSRLQSLETGQARIEGQLLERLNAHMAEDRSVFTEQNKKLEAQDKMLDDIKWKLAYYSGALAALGVLLKFLWK